MQFFLFLSFAVAVVFVIIAFQNQESISIRFIKWDLNETLALVLALPYAAGIVTSLFLFIPLWWKKSRQIRIRGKRINELESQLKQLEAKLVPVEDERREEESRDQKRE